MSKITRTALLSGALFVAVAGQAQAATTLGQTFAPDFPTCSAVNTFVQGVDPSAGASYHAPSPGVITSWSYQADASVDEHLKFKVAQPLGGNNYAIVGESALETITAGVLNTFPTQISIQTGYTIGYYNPDGAGCIAAADPGSIIHLSTGDKLPGDPWTTPASQSQYKLDVSAQLEPDADNDGFGDETQDGCPADATTQGQCGTGSQATTTPPPKKCKKGRKLKKGKCVKKKRKKKRR